MQYLPQGTLLWGVRNLVHAIHGFPGVYQKDGVTVVSACLATPSTATLVTQCDCQLNSGLPDPSYTIQTNSGLYIAGATCYLLREKRNHAYVEYFLEGSVLPSSWRIRHNHDGVRGTDVSNPILWTKSPVSVAVSS